MRHGITFRGKHSNDIGVLVKTVGRPIIAPVKQIDEEVQYRDGNIDCSESGGRIYYNDKVLELEFCFISPNSVELHVAVAKFVNWLAGGYGELIFDDMPTIVWLAKPVDLDNLSIELYKNGKIRVQFRCNPFNQWLYDSTGIPLDSDIVLDSDLRLDLGDENEIKFGALESSITMEYYGSAPVRPVCALTLLTGVNEVKIKVNGAEMQIKPNNGEKKFEIDCKNGIMPSGVTGDFFELLPGENKITINSSGGGGELIFKYRHNFLYGGDF